MLEFVQTTEVFQCQIDSHIRFRLDRETHNLGRVITHIDMRLHHYIACMERILEQFQRRTGRIDSSTKRAYKGQDLQELPKIYILTFDQLSTG